jgi:hypothetical protein
MISRRIWWLRAQRYTFEFLALLGAVGVVLVGLLWFTP